MSELVDEDILSQIYTKGLLNDDELLKSNTNLKEVLHSYLLNNGLITHGLGNQFKELILEFLFETLDNLLPFHEYKNEIENYINTILKQNANIILSISVELSHDKEFMFQVVKHQARVYKVTEHIMKYATQQFRSDFRRKQQPILDRRSQDPINNRAAIDKRHFFEFLSRNSVLMSDNMFRARIVHVLPQLGCYLLKNNQEIKLRFTQLKQQISKEPCLIEFLRNNPIERLFYFEVSYCAPYGISFLPPNRILQFSQSTAPDEIDSCFDIGMMSYSHVENYLKTENLNLEDKRACMLKIIKYHCLFLSDEFFHIRNDKEFVREALSVNGSYLRNVSNEFLNDKDLILEAVSQCGTSLKYVPNKFLDDKEVGIAAVTQDIGAFCCTYHRFSDHKDVVLAAVSMAGSLLSCCRKLRNDKDVVLAAVVQDMNCLSFASDELRNDSEFIKTLIDVTGGEVFQYASNKLKNDYYSVLTAIKDYPPALSWASQDLQEDRYLQLTAVYQGGTLPPRHSARLEACIRSMKSQYSVQFATFLSTLLFATSSVYVQYSLPLCSMSCLKTLGKYGLRRTNTLIAEYAGVQFGEEKWKMISTIPS